MFSLPRINANRLYLGTFFYLSRGDSRDKAIEYLECGRSSVYDYAKDLVGEGYLKRIPGSRSPQLYERGPKANILDSAISELGFRFDGGTVKPPQSPEQVNTPKFVTVATSRTHINGRVMFEVIRQGDMSRLKVPIGPSGDGKFVYLPLFPEKPVDLANGVREYRTRVPWNGKQVAVHYIESDKGASSLHIWPYEKELTAEELTQDTEQLFTEEAQRIVNSFSKYGAWQFGLVNFKGEIHHASDDPAILSQFADDVRNIPGTPFWIDNSHGHREIETKDPESMQMLLNFKTHVKRLDEGQESSINRIYILELKADKMLALLEKFSEIMERDAELTTKVIEKEVAGTAERVVKSKTQAAEATATTQYDGVMYQ